MPQPEKAVEAYETALIKNPKDSSLAKKIGQAYIKSHHYNKAINYYSAALKSGHQQLLRYDLAELYFKLNQLENAEQVLAEVCNDASGNSTDAEQLNMVAKCHLLFYEINLKRARTDALLASLNKAKECTLKATKRAQVDNTDLLPDLKVMVSK